MQHVRPAYRSRWLPLRRSILILSVVIIYMLCISFSPQRVSQAAGSAIWYVAPNGDDIQDCRAPTSACQTIGAAVTKASAGDQISAATGVYTEHLTLDKTLTLVGANPATTILDGFKSGMWPQIAGLGS